MEDGGEKRRGHFPVLSPEGEIQINSRKEAGAGGACLFALCATFDNCENVPPCRGGVPSPPGGGFMELAYAFFEYLYLVLPIPPHFFGLAQRNGVEPQRKTPLGWWRPREVSGPTRLSHSRGRCHSAAKVSASRTD